MEHLTNVWVTYLFILHDEHLLAVWSKQRMIHLFHADLVIQAPENTCLLE